MSVYEKQKNHPGGQEEALQNKKNIYVYQYTCVVAECIIPDAIRQENISWIFKKTGKLQSLWYVKTHDNNSRCHKLNNKYMQDAKSEL